MNNLSATPGFEPPTSRLQYDNQPHDDGAALKLHYYCKQNMRPGNGPFDPPPLLDDTVCINP